MMCETTWQREFVKRHKCSLTHKHGMMLFHSTVTANIVAETDRLIESCGQLVERNRMLSFSLMVFDETVVSCCQKLGKMVGLWSKRNGKGVLCA